MISVDTKKKELVGDFKNAGQEWHPAGQPPAVRVHDFKDDELGKAIPYGVYDLGANAGLVVNLGPCHGYGRRRRFHPKFLSYPIAGMSGCTKFDGISAG